MEKRMPGSMRTRETLSQLIEGRLSAPDACSELVRLATRLVVEEALEAESRDALGRGTASTAAIPTAAAATATAPAGSRRPKGRRPARRRRSRAAPSRSARRSGRS